MTNQPFSNLPFRIFIYLLCLAFFDPVVGFSADFRSALNQAKEVLNAGKLGEAEKQLTVSMADARSESERLEVKAWQMKAKNTEGLFKEAQAIGATLSNSPDANDTIASFLILQRADAEKGLGNFERAEAEYLSLLDTPPNSKEATDIIADAAVRLAEIRMWRGNWVEAASSLQKALSLYPLLEPAGQARIIIQQGDFARTKGQLENAEDFYNKAIAILSKLQRYQDPDLAIARIGLIEIRLEQGREREVQPLLAETRDICGLLESSEANLGFEDVRGRTELALRDQAVALVHIRDTALIGRQSNEHFETVLSLDSVGAMDLRIGDTNGAITNLEKARDSLQRSLGQNSPLLASTLVHLAQSYRLAKRQKEAANAIQDAARIEAEYLSKDTLYAATCGFEQGSIAIEQKDYVKAETVFRRVHEVRSHLLLAQDPRRVDTEGNWGIALAFLGRGTEAEPLLKSWVTAHASNAPSLLGPNALQINTAYASALYALKRYSDAIPLYQTAVQMTKDSAQKLDALQNLGDCYLQVRNFPSAAKALGDAFELTFQSSNDKPSRDRVAFLLSTASIEVGNLDQAESATAIWMKDIATHDLSSQQLDVINKLAEGLYKKLAYAKAEPYLRRIMEAVGSTSSASVTERLMLQLATVCEHQEKSAEAAELFQRLGESLVKHDTAGAKNAFDKSLRLREKAQGPETPAMVPVLRQLAHIEVIQRRYAEAGNLLDQAQAILNREEHVDLSHAAAILNERGMIAQNQGRSSEAELLYQKANSQIATDPSASRRLRADILFNLGSLAFEDTSRPNDADKYFSQCLKLGEGASVAEPPPAEEIEEIGLFFQRNKRYGDAEAQYLKASQIRSDVYGKESPQAAAGYYTLARFYVDTQKFDRASSYANQALKIFEAHSLGENTEENNTLSLLADIYEYSGNYQEAIPKRERLVSSLESAGRPNTDRHLQLTKLGDDYSKVHDYQNALATFQKIAQIWNGDRGLGDPNYREAEQNVLVALQEMGKHDEAERMFQTIRKYLKDNKRPWQEEYNLLNAYVGALRDGNQPSNAKEANKLDSEAKRLKLPQR